MPGTQKRGRPIPVAMRRMISHRMVLTAAAVTVALAAACAAGLTAYSGAAGTAAVRSALTDGTASTTIEMFGSAPHGSAQQASAEVSARLRAALDGADVTMYDTPELDSISLPGSTSAQSRLVDLLGPPELSTHARLLAGSWPAPASSATPAAAPVPVAIESPVATLLHLRPGSVVPSVTSVGNPVTFEVVGVFAPVGANSPYWGLDPLPATGEQPGSNFTTFGPFFTDPSYLAANSPAADGALAAGQMHWMAVPDIHALGGGDVASAGAGLTAALTALGEDQAMGNPSSTTRLPQLLTGLGTAALVAQSLVYTELLELLVVAAAALLIVVGLLKETRESEAALLWARGATGGQLLRLRAAESVLLAIPAVVLAPILARPTATEIGRIGSGGPAIAITALSGTTQIAVWAAVAAAAVGGIAVILGPALGAAVSPVTLRARRGRQGAVGTVGRAGLDLALIALAVVVCWQSDQNDSLLSTDQAGNPGYSPVAIAAPALVLAAGAVVVLRLLPLVARLGNLLARRGRSLALPLAFWETGRKPLKLGGLVLLTMLSVAAGVLSLSEYSSAQRSAADQAAFNTGADADLRFTGRIDPAVLSAVGAAPGVSAVSPLYRGTFVTGTAGLQATLLGLDPASAARTVLMRPDLSPVPVSTLMSKLAGAPVNGAVPAVVTQALADTFGLTTGSGTSVTIGGSALPVQVIAVVSQFPTVSTPGGGMVIDLATAVKSKALKAPDKATLTPDELWLRDTSTATPNGLPAGTVVTFRTEVQHTLRTAPLAEEPMQALLALALAAALLALCGMAAGVIAASDERSEELALLDALGLARRSRIGLLCVEQAMVAIPGALAGIALGLFLGRLVVPAATLAADASKPQPPVSVLTPWTPVALGAAVMVAVPLVVAALAGARRRNTATLLREGTDR